MEYKPNELTYQTNKSVVGSSGFKKKHYNKAKRQGKNVREEDAKWRHAERARLKIGGDPDVPFVHRINTTINNQGLETMVNQEPWHKTYKAGYLNNWNNFTATRNIQSSDSIVHTEYNGDWLIATDLEKQDIINYKKADESWRIKVTGKHRWVDSPEKHEIEINHLEKE